MWRRRGKKVKDLKAKLEKAEKDLEAFQLEAIRGPDEFRLLRLENIYDVIKMLKKKALL